MANKYNIAGALKKSIERKSKVGFLVNLKKNLVIVFVNGKYSGIYSNAVNPSKDYYVAMFFGAPNVQCTLKFPSSKPKPPKKLF
jgi:hypothetical protein